MRIRKKTWDEKVVEVSNAYSRVKDEESLGAEFYKNLFFLSPKIKDKFQNTDWEHQKKALRFGLEDIIGFLTNPKDAHFRNQITRLAHSHSKHGLNIHPQNYYYWIEAIIMTFKNLDPKWYDDLEYYTRECIFFPISFMISLYHQDIS